VWGDRGCREFVGITVGLKLKCCVWEIKGTVLEEIVPENWLLARLVEEWRLSKWGKMSSSKTTCLEINTLPVTKSKQW
jgi:hypothetical protein